MARYDDLNTGMIAYSSFIGCVILLVLILLGRALCYAWVENEDDRKLAKASYEASDATISEQLSQLADYQRVKPATEETDEQDSTAAESDAAGEPAERLVIPIERARDLLLKEMAAPAPDA